MKKLLSILLLCAALLCLLCAIASAEVLPAEIEKVIGSDRTVVAEGKPYGDIWFILTRKDNTHTIYCFTLRNGTWKHSFHAVKSVPQGKNGTEMRILDFLQDPVSGVQHNGPVLMLGKLDGNKQQYEQTVYYQRSSSGVWNAVCLIDTRSNSGTIEIGKDYAEYYKWDGKKLKQTKVRGTVQRDIRYMSLQSFPMTAADARNRLTFAPDLPANSELSAQDVQFTGGKKYSVYSMPDASSLRGGNGKAAVSTNGWIQVFGQENGWILIQYSIDNSHYRFGYIEAAALPKDADVRDLGFFVRDARMLNDASVTDDPLYSRSPLAAVSQGENVLWLATMGDWAYIEGRGFRGFVPLNSLTTEMPSAPANTEFTTYTDANGQSYSLFEINKMHYDGNHHVYAVSGQFVRTVEGEEDFYPESAENGKLFTYNLASDFRAMMITDTAEGDTFSEVNDLYSWYIRAYLGGQAPAGEMVFQCDLPEEQRFDGSYDFWFVTTRIHLNQNQEIDYMEYVYVPWG